MPHFSVSHFSVLHFCDKVWLHALQETPGPLHVELRIFRLDAEEEPVVWMPRRSVTLKTG